MPRSLLEQFDDVANREIIDHRQIYNLHTRVPFHFYANNPFDGSVQTAYPDREFILIAVTRDLARARNWEIIPRHPLAGPFNIFSYDEGFNQIDWDLMNTRAYQDRNCKQVCMAECLAPGAVPASLFTRLYVRNDENRTYIQHILELHHLTTPVNVNAYMFHRGR